MSMSLLSSLAAFYSSWNLFSGFIIPRHSTPKWWRWYAWVCPVAYTLYGLVASQFGDIDDKILKGQNITVQKFIEGYFLVKVIHSQRRDGLLRLMKVLHSLGLQVTDAKVTTCKGRVLNIFKIEPIRRPLWRIVIDVGYIS